MLLEIAVDGNGRDLVSLRDWLIAEPSIRRFATVALEAPAAVRGAMGSTAEIIAVTAGLTLDVASLLVAVATWTQSRNKRAGVTIRQGDVEVTITGNDPALLDVARRLLEEGRS